jgi:ADP-dependent phosphofructokinase/glucokinase
MNLPNTLNFCIQGSEDTIHRQLRFLLKKEDEWIQYMLKKDEEEALEAIRAAEAAAAEGLTVILQEQPEEKPERKMFKRLKMLMVYHSISTVCYHVLLVNIDAKIILYPR